MDIGLLSAYLPMDRRHALAMGRSLSDRADGSVLLADIAGFTPLADSLAVTLGPQRGAEELTRLLNAVYDTLVAEVHRFGGSVVSFVGDALICWFESDRGLRAVSCGLKMQRAMEAYAAVEVLAGGTVSFSMKAGVALGPVRRFVVGDPEVQRLDVLAGMALERVAQAEQLARRGEVVVGPEAALQLEARPNGRAQRLEVAEWREGYGVVEGLWVDVPPAPWPELNAEALTVEQMRAYLLPPVYERLISGHGEYLAELRPAVMLFLGFSGLDYDGEAGPQLDAYVRWVQGVLARYDGYLLQLTIGDKGSFLYAAFGALAAHEDDAVRAVAAALELQRLPPDLDFLSGVRIGVSQGRVRTGAYGSRSRRTYGVIGNEVNIACRLMEAAPAGGVRCSQRIHRAASGRWQFEGLSPVRVKGRAEPLMVYRPLGQRRARGLIAGGMLVGRQAEVEVLARVLAEAAEGQRRVLFLEGEAGIGKSRLVGKLARLADEREVAWLLGAGQSIEQRTPYRAWRDLLSAHLGLDDQMELVDRQRWVEEWVRDTSPSLVERTPLLNDILRLDLPETDLTHSFDPKLRHESLTALVIDLLGAAAAKAPLVLVLEDAHWLDSLSWGLVLSVARALYNRSFLVVVALRPLEELRPPEYSALAGLEGTEMLRLEAMPPDETVVLAAARLGLTPEALPAEVADLVRERAGGNPFFAEELAHALHDSGVLLIKEGICTIAGDPSLDPGQVLDGLRQSMPDTVEGVVLSRIDRLTPEEQLTLKVAAVIGRSFLYRTLSDVHPQQVVEDLLHTYLDSLARRDLTPLEALEPELSYLFKHIITQQVAYDTLLFSQRRELHRSVAGWYEQAYAEALSPYYPLLVHHWHQAEEEERERHYARLAGEQAAAQYANAEAVAYLGRALELTPESARPDRVALLLAREKVHGLLGDREAQSQDLAALHDLAETLPGQQQAEIALRQAFYAEVIADYDQCVTSARTAVELARSSGAVDQEIDGYLRWGVALIRQGKGDEATPQIEQALALARACGLRKREGDSLLDLGLVALDQGRYGQARSVFEQALEIYRSLGDRRNESSAYNNLGNVAYFQSDFRQAVVYLEKSLQLSRQIGNSVNAGLCLNNLGVVAMETADYALGRTYLEQALDLSRAIGERRSQGLALSNLGAVALAQGDYDQARAYREQALRINREIGYRAGEISDLNAMTILFLHLGDRAQAATCIQEALHLSREMGYRRGESDSLDNLARLSQAQGDGAGAVEYSRQAAQIARELGDDTPLANALTSLGHALASLGCLAEAKAAHQEALQLRRQMEFSHLAMDSLAGLARVYLAENDLGQAIDCVDEILAYEGTATLAGVDEPFRVYLACYLVLQSAGDPRAAEILSRAYGLLQARAATIGDEVLRRSFLEHVTAQREIMAAYQAMKSAR
jgi:class 3 adenylate cyclase/tetratricopeptide (TPR) repeat protein